MKYSNTLLALASFFLAGNLLDNQVHAQGSLAACADITVEEERLACYDLAAETTRNLPVVRLPRNSRPQTTDTDVDAEENAGVVRQDDFGLELSEERQQQAGPDTRSYRVVAARHNDFTGWTIELEGGGTWKQVGTDDYSIEVGKIYTVTRRTFNSYLLSNASNNKKMRITRVQE